MLTKPTLVYRLHPRNSSAASAQTIRNGSATESSGHLNVVPFKVGLKTHDSEGPSICVEGDEQGVITVNSNGNSKHIKVHSDGTLSCRRKLKFQADGSVILEDGRAVPIKVSDDGTVSISGRPAFTRWGDTLIDADPEHSFFGFDRPQILVEGDQSANRLIAVSVAFCLTNHKGDLPHALAG